MEETTPITIADHESEQDGAQSGTVAPISRSSGVENISANDEWRM
jgi:hypothetical protein